MPPCAAPPSPPTQPLLPHTCRPHRQLYMYHPSLVLLPNHQLSLIYPRDGICDDGGPGSTYSDCTYGHDCDDCSLRHFHPPPAPPSAPPLPPLPPSPPAPPPSPCPPSVPPTQPGICRNTCAYPDDAICDDGGPGSTYSDCVYGHDCDDCSIRNYLPLLPPLPPSSAPPPPSLPPHPSIPPIPASHSMVQSVAALRNALRYPPADGRVRIYLAEAMRVRLGGVPLLVHHSDLAIIGGDGAMIDAEGLSRHFDVALGGRLHLENMHLMGGGREMTGGSVLVRYGAALTTKNVAIIDSMANSMATTRGGASAAANRNDFHEMLTVMAGSEVESCDFSPDKRRTTCGTHGRSVTIRGESSYATADYALTLALVAEETSAHIGFVNVVMFSPDGTRIVSGGMDGSIKL
eukprot:7391605-Prymnesium_polylepis.7